MSKKSMSKIVEINKQELSTERVELALDSEVKSALKDLDKYINVLDNGESTFDKLDREYDTLSNKYYKLRAEVINSRNNLKKIESQIKDVMTKYESASKNLGIKANTIKEYKLN